MPNLVGIGNSQVPTNAMLGGLAYQDSVGEINLEKIKARTSDTALDVFVYDTRKDSDGGAWRHRTQNTSWYNEGVSVTRGARKEFPAVAVIVVEEESASIYDGDDPNLPLWMKFNAGSGGDNIFNRPTAWDITTVFALNGIVCITNGANSAESTLALNYVNDSVRLYPISGYTAYGGDYTLGIAGRSSSSGDYITIDQVIVGDKANDVAMTVLPNAPIDASTGLPTPTIAVATGHGLSIIKDNGNVVDITGTHGGAYNDAQFVNFDSKTNAIISGFDYGAGNTNAIYKLNILPIPSVDFVVPGTYGGYQNHSSRIQTGGNDTIPKLQGNYLRDTISAGGDGRYAIRTGDSLSTGYPGALNIIQEEPGTDGSNTTYASNSRIVYITKDYNTGWMHGDIKGAFLSDTNDTNLTSTNLVSNGTFGSNINGWNGAGSGGTATVSHDSGRLKLVSSSGNQHAHTTVTCVVGKKYYFQADFQGQISFHVSTQGDAGNDRGYIPHVNYGSSTTKFLFFTATQTTMYLVPYVIGTSNVGYVDNVICQLADHDRSLSGERYATFSGIAGLSSGLKVNGTVSRAPVATGAELVYYGGFSNSNYFSQPYNSALDFGTGDLYIMFWAKFTQNNAYDDIIHRRAHNGSAYTGNGWYLQMGSNNNIVLKDNLGGSRAVMDGDSTFGVWQHFCFVRRSNVGYSYKNGVQGSSTTPAWTENLDNSSAVLTIGRGTISGSGDADKTFLALVRIGAGAPSEEQIKKIYNDEKHLFDENAKCTLYGTSDDIKGIAYDDTTDVLHAGTSSGRSDFRGLNRINNTTTAVTTAISASNELVAEQ